MEELDLFCCQNPQCLDYGLRGRGNLRVAFRYGADHRRMLACRSCQLRFSERKGTALERSQLPTDKVVSVLDHLREGCGVRATSRLTGVSRDTISRYIALAGNQSKNLHDELVAFSPSNP